MKRYEIYIIKSLANGNDYCNLRAETNNIDHACDLAYEIENTCKENFDATAIYDNDEHKWFGYHKKGTAYILSK